MGAAWDGSPARTGGGGKGEEGDEDAGEPTAGEG